MRFHLAIKRRPRLVPTLAFLTFVLGFLGCSKPKNFFRDYTQETGNLGAFILQHAPKLGIRFQQTNDLPQLMSTWRYKQNADTLSVYVEGDCFTQLQSYLTTAFGKLTNQIATNTIGKSKSIQAWYEVEQLGAGLTYSWCLTGDGKQFTSFGVARKEYLEKLAKP